MGISKKLQQEAMHASLHDPKVYQQIQKNTEKLLNKKQRESFMVAKEAMKELLDLKYDELIKSSIIAVMAELKQECKEAILEDNK